jgi:NAD(P)-dependent dehydrogenase (short-subunit alcohol dehydrogenase family)
MLLPELRDAVVLITGGANGIGAAMVRAFCAQGAAVFFCDVDARAGMALAKELKSRATFTKVDLAEEKEIVAWVKAIAAGRKTIHTLVNNAARDTRIDFATMTAVQWDELHAVNLRAYFLTAREASRHMSPGASIINFASIVFHEGPAALTAYTASKGGVLGFTRSLARALGSRRIRVNTLSPGWVMTERQLRTFVTPAVKRRIREAQCVPELLQPEEIADVALFLASDASRAITGQEILADRGWHHS